LLSINSIYQSFGSSSESNPVLHRRTLEPLDHAGKLPVEWRRLCSTLAATGVKAARDCFAEFITKDNNLVKLEVRYRP